MPVQTREEAIAAILKVLEPRTDLQLAVLHGSAAAGTLRRDSDIDLSQIVDKDLVRIKLDDVVQAMLLSGVSLHEWDNDVDAAYDSL